MKWGIIRLVIIGSSFLVGMLVASYQNSEVLAPGTPVADLSSTKGTSLVVTCEAGDPTVEHVVGLSGSLEVRCEKSHVRVTRFGGGRRKEEKPPEKTGPSSPMATMRKDDWGGKSSS